jgi:hypothetical protein
MLLFQKHFLPASLLRPRIKYCISKNSNRIRKVLSFYYFGVLFQMKNPVVQKKKMSTFLPLIWEKKRNLKPSEKKWP